MLTGFLVGHWWIVQRLVLAFGRWGGLSKGRVIRQWRSRRLRICKWILTTSLKNDGRLSERNPNNYKHINAAIVRMQISKAPTKIRDKEEASETKTNSLSSAERSLLEHENNSKPSKHLYSNRIWVCYCLLLVRATTNSNCAEQQTSKKKLRDFVSVFLWKDEKLQSTERHTRFLISVVFLFIKTTADKEKLSRRKLLFFIAKLEKVFCFSSFHALISVW